MALAAAGFGTLGPLARFAADVGLTTVSFAVWRAIASLVALVVLLVLGLAAGRVSTTPWASIGRREWVQLAAMGVFVAGTTLSLFSAFERTTIALTLIVFYTFPVMVALAAVPLYGEQPGARRLAALALASFGLVLLLASPAMDGAAADLDPLGIAFALAAAGFQASYALVASRGFASVPALQAATALRGFSVLIYTLVLVPLVVLVGEAATLVDPIASAEAWLLILVAGVIGAALPTVLLVSGYRRVGPTRGAVVMLVEPVVGVLLAALLLAEQPTPLQLVGGLLVLVGAALVQLAPARRVEPVGAPLAE